MNAAPLDPVAQLFKRLDLTQPELSAVKAAVEAGKLDAATEALALHFRTRKVRVPGDPRPEKGRAASKGVLEEADAALENRFIGQSSYGFQKVPDDIDWSFNPGKDPEWTWQFNRHSAWHALGRAYLGTGDEKYARKWVALLRDWIDKNPPGTPWSWRTLEAGLRGASWIPIYLSFLDSPAFTPRDHAAFLNSLADHAEYLLPTGHFSSGSNWGQFESLGLLHVGAFFPEFRDARLWRETAWKRLEGEMFKQVLEDGAQVELTTSYHQGCISGFVDAAEVARLGGVEPSEAYWKRLERMCEYTLFLSKPDGTQPMLGDSWPGDTRGVLLEGARRFSRKDMLYVGSRGKEGAKPERLDTLLPAAGYCVMRTDWIDPKALYLLLDVAHRWGGWHQHPDCLQVELYAYGKTLLVDSGSYLYYGPERERFCRTSSHNTVTVDDKNQNTSPATLHCSASSDLLSFADGSQEGYPGITHRRQVLFVKPADGMPAYILVVDRLTGQGRHRADQYFHFQPAPLELAGAAFEARTALPGGPNLLVRALRSSGLTLEQVESWVSFNYGKKEPRPAIRYRREGELPLTFVTLLVPFEGAAPPGLKAEEVSVTAGSDAIAVRVEGAGFRDLLFMAPEPTAPGVPEVTERARAGLVRTDAGGKVLRRQLIGGGNA